MFLCHSSFHKPNKPKSKKWIWGHTYIQLKLVTKIFKINIKKSSTHKGTLKKKTVYKRLHHEKVRTQVPRQLASHEFFVLRDLTVSGGSHSLTRIPFNRRVSVPTIHYHVLDNASSKGNMELIFGLIVCRLFGSRRRAHVRCLSARCRFWRAAGLSRPSEKR